MAHLVGAGARADALGGSCSDKRLQVFAADLAGAVNAIT
jgi:hypothetical protein